MTARPSLRDVIEQKGLKAIWIAQQLGISKSQMSNIMAQRRTVGEGDARVIAALLGRPVDDIFLCSKEHISDDMGTLQSRSVA